MFKLQVVLTIFLICISFLQAQTITTEEINSQFRLAVNMFNSENYEQAMAIFEKIVTDNKYNSKTTAAEFFKVKILFEQKKYEKTKLVLNNFIEKYPGSRYIDEVRMLLIKYNLEVANYYNAFNEAVLLITLAKSGEYKQQARQIGEGVALNYLNDTQLQRVYNVYSSEEAKSFVLLQMGKVLVKANDIFGAKSVFNDLITKYPNSEEYSEAKKLYDYPFEDNSVSLSTITIGVMLPLETNSAGEYTSATSIEILEGIKFALHEYNKVRDDKVGIIIRDTRSDLEEIKKIRDELSGISSVKAVLGPIYSNEVRATLQEFNSYNIPIMSPTATDDDLTEISEDFFQANPSFSVRGRVMAQYLFYVENKRKISILNSIDGYSPLLAATFTEEFEKLGGTVVRKETYKDGGFSFDESIGRIASDSRSIEGIYIPLSDNSAAPMILASLVKYNFNIPIYGNQDWLTAKGFETSPEISNNLTFTTDYFFDFQSDDYHNFNSEFLALTGKDINRNILYGYDAAKYLLTAIRNIEPTRANIKSKILSGMISNGYHNNISFGKKRINRFLNIVRYKDGVFELVDKFRLNE